MRSKALLDRRLMMTINSAIDLETAKCLRREFSAPRSRRAASSRRSSRKADKAADPEGPGHALARRHDHGPSITARRRCSTSIRETRVAEREAGGITQAHRRLPGERR
jgi:hypothetical protein